MLKSIKYYVHATVSLNDHRNTIIIIISYMYISKPIIYINSLALLDFGHLSGCEGINGVLYMPLSLSFHRNIKR